MGKNHLLFDEGSNKKFELMYKGSLERFRSSRFHEKCDKLGSPTICFVLSENGNIFGGYVSIDWNQYYIKIDENKKETEGTWGHRNDENAFIFSLTNRTKHVQRPN